MIENLCSVKNIEWLTPEIMSLSCTMPTGYKFKAGQYAMIQSSNMNEARAYSIASAENSDLINFHIKKPDKSSPAVKELLNIKENENINISNACGNNHIKNTNKNIHIALIAGGVGIAPMYSIIKTLYKLNSEQQISLFWGGDHKEDIYLQKELTKIKESHHRFSYHLSCLHFNDKNIKQGYITDLLHGFINEIKGSDIHIAGPKTMMIKTIEILLNAKIKEKNISYDKFW